MIMQCIWITYKTQDGEKIFPPSYLHVLSNRNIIIPVEQKHAIHFAKAL